MISIIIPTLNEEKIIARTIVALKSGLTLPHEIIISDGKSGDQTIEIAKKYADRVVAYGDTKRQTIAQGRNDGAKVARGDYFVFLDADCTIPDPDQFFQHALDRFTREPQLVALSGYIRVLPEHATFADNFFSGLMNLIFRLENNFFQLGDSWGEFQMIRPAAFRQLGGFREDLVAAEDGDMFRRLSQIGQTRTDPKLSVFHTGRRMHKVGWPKLLSLWFMNAMSVKLLGHSTSKEWTPIR